LFCVKQKTAYEITDGDWSSDVCSSDLELELALSKKQIKIPFYGIHYTCLENDLAELKKQIKSKI